MSRVESKLTLDPPRLVLVTGVGGAGKSSLIEGLYAPDGQFYPGLIHRIDADIVDKDGIANRFTEVRGESYITDFRPQSYEQVFQKTAMGIASGRTIFVNASFRLEIASPLWYRRYEELAREHRALLKIIRVVTSPDTLYRRIMARQAPTDAHKITDPRTWQAYLHEEPIEVEMPPGSLILTNNGENFPDLVEQALTFLNLPCQV